MTTTTDRHDLRRALDMERAIMARASERADEHPLGLALHDASLPDVWTQNQLHVLGLAGDIDDLIRILDDLYGERRHRRVIVEDEVEGQRLAAGFRDRGWQVMVTLYMALREKPTAEADGSLACEVSEAQLREVEARALAEEPNPRAREIVDQLLEARRRHHAAAEETRYVAGLADGELVGTTTLYRCGNVAQIESVDTLAPFRRRGIGRAMVAFAIELAHDADLIWIPADDDDWPKELYATLGFRPLGRTFAFTLPGR